MMNRLYSILLLVLLILALPSLSYGAGAARIDKLKINEILLPGEAKEGVINVTNSQDEVMYIKIYTEDWKFAPGGQGSRIFAPPGSLKGSCSSWVTLYPDQMTLAPKASAKIRYSINAPPDARGGYRSVIFVENLIGQQEQETRTVNLSARLASILYVDIRGTASKIPTITSLEVYRKARSKRLDLKLDFHNEGNSHIIVKPTFNILSSEGLMIARGEFSKIYTLPQDNTTSTTQWLGTIPPGTHDFILTMDLGDNQILVKEWPITIPEAGEPIKENLL